MTPRHRAREQHMTREQLRKRYPRRKTEPALIRGGIVAVLSVLTTFGVKWAANVDEVKIEVLAVAIPSVAIGLAALIRVAVTASAKVVARVSVSQGRVVLGDAGELGTAPGDTLPQPNLPHPGY